MSVIIPIQAQKSAVYRVLLNGQNTKIALYQKGANVFADVFLSGNPLKYMQICINRVLIVRQPYLGFVGDLAFMDMQGNSDPQWSGLGSRWQLVYLNPGEFQFI